MKGLGDDGQILSILNQNSISKYHDMSDHFKKLVRQDNKYMALFIQLTDTSLKYDKRIAQQIRKIQNVLSGFTKWTCQLCLHDYTSTAHFRQHKEE